MTASRRLDAENRQEEDLAGLVNALSHVGQGAQVV